MTTDEPADDPASGLGDDLAIAAFPLNEKSFIASKPVAPQQNYGPRPLPLFIDMVQRETQGNPARVASVLAGVRAFQNRPRTGARIARPIVARAGRAVLLDYGGSGPDLILVPSLINPPDILDLMPENSLATWLATQGFHVFLVDWGCPTPSEKHVDITAYVENMLAPLLASRPAPPHVMGYCIGGTMAIAAAFITPVASLALVAVPWHFSGFPETARADQMQLWKSAKSAARAMGLLPMEVLQSGFWQLDPARSVSKYIGFDALDQESASARRFMAVEDWANAGPPLTYAAARQAFVDFFEQDLPGSGKWQVGGRTADPAALPCPVFDIISLTDNIVPAAAASRVPDRLLLNLGHVGMVVGSSARTLMWEPLRDWFLAQR